MGTWMKTFVFGRNKVVNLLNEDFWTLIIALYLFNTNILAFDPIYYFRTIIE